MTAESLPATSGAGGVLQEYRMTDVGLERIRTIMDEVMGGRKLTIANLDRVRIPTGAATAWTVPGFTGEQVVPTLTGIIVAVRSTRAYWGTSFDEQPGQPPDCVSDDGLTGTGEPGGACETCPFAQFGSDVRRDGTAGRGCACREMRLLFVKTPQVWLPTVIVAPRTSIRPVQDYLLSLANYGYDYTGVVTEFALTKEKNEGGIAYARMKLTPKDVLPEEVARATHAYAQAIKPFLQTTRIPLERADAGLE